jgi:hypothetical protein
MKKNNQMNPKYSKANDSSKKSQIPDTCRTRSKCGPDTTSLEMTTTKVLPRWPRMYGHASRKNPTNSSPGSTAAPPPPEPELPTAQHRTPGPRQRRVTATRRSLPEGSPFAAARAAGRETSPARRPPVAHVAM